jgi:hypothetical protein
VGLFWGRGAGSGAMDGGRTGARGLTRQEVAANRPPEQSHTPLHPKTSHNLKRKKVGQADDAHTEGNVPLLPSSPGGVSAPVSHRAWPIIPIGKVLELENPNCWWR